MPSVQMVSRSCHEGNLSVYMCLKDKVRLVMSGLANLGQIESGQVKFRQLKLGKVKSKQVKLSQD